MQGSRPARIGDQIREELSELLARHVKDPGIGFITITHVKVSPDLQIARAFYTTLGDDKARKETAKALDRATPFLRRQIAGRLRLRRAPELTFQFDDSIEKQMRVEQLIQEIHATDAAAAQSLSVDQPVDPLTDAPADPPAEPPADGAEPRR
jgi:ribosome-binding factor A